MIGIGFVVVPEVALVHSNVLLANLRERAAAWATAFAGTVHVHDLVLIVIRLEDVQFQGVIGAAAATARKATVFRRFQDLQVQVAALFE
jgi:hypothetical protein